VCVRVDRVRERERRYICHIFCSIGLHHASPHQSAAMDGDISSDSEGESGYRRGGYHRVKIGDVYDNRYTVHKKLVKAYICVCMCVYV
jgi:hypothetical protein